MLILKVPIEMNYLLGFFALDLKLKFHETISFLKRFGVDWDV